MISRDSLYNGAVFDSVLLLLRKIAFSLKAGFGAPTEVKIFQRLQRPQALSSIVICKVLFIIIFHFPKEIRKT